MLSLSRCCSHCCCCCSHCCYCSHCCGLHCCCLHCYCCRLHFCSPFCFVVFFCVCGSFFLFQGLVTFAFDLILLDCAQIGYNMKIWQILAHDYFSHDKVKKRYKMRATRKMERSKSVTFFFGCNFGEIICCFFFYGVNGRCHGVKTKTDLNWSYSGDITCSLHYLTSPKLSHNSPFF